MLQSLHVKNIALMDDVEIDFTDGLNILSGETGAGKSIIIDAVNFALGQRMPKDAVRDEGENALCELVFYVGDIETQNALKAIDVIPDEGQVILQRRIMGGKSSCKVNGETVTASAIREIASLLIDIHGQHEHQSLLDRKNHRILLDSFCGEGLTAELCKLNEAFEEYDVAQKEYDKAVASKDSVREDLDYSRFVAGEISSADLKPQEDETLEDEFKRMNNSRRIAEIMSGVSSVLMSDGQSAQTLIGHALSQIKQAADLDDAARPLYDQLLAAEDIVNDCARSVLSYEESLEFSPGEYERVRERLDVINSLKMKYGQTIEDINRRLLSESEKIEKLSDYENYLEQLKEKKEQTYEQLEKECSLVSGMRKKEAAILQKDISDALGSLNFLDSRFEISVRNDASKITRNGYDEIEFLISTNPGEDLKPLANIASGGELSRIMLAIKSVVSKRDSIGTMIFDEIDSGISGKTAQLVANRMTEIARDHQVIAVTHLPQIASHADTHFLIEKQTHGNHTSTTVKTLSYDGSVEELARMLAGDTITEAVLKNARELKKTK